MLGDDLLLEMKVKNAKGQKVKFTSESEKGLYSIDQKRKRPKSLKEYTLGSRYGRAYFTRREAECMLLILRGKTIDKVAELLMLSPRTVEYYVKNMKAKVGCRTKFELIDLIHESDFLKNLDFK